MSSSTNKANFSNLIKTIGDDEEVEDFSEESDAEIEFQPTKQKNKQKAEFNTDFQFVSSTEEYNKDTWSDLNKYIKRKAKSKTDDKIRQSILDRKDVKDESGSEMSLSDDELKCDTIKDRQKRIKKQKDVDVEEFFERNPEQVDAEGASFYQMNLSRPLLKAIGIMKFIHPTPIQASTIPVALLGKDICGCAATGTGKTAAYMLPTLERLLYRPSGGPNLTRVLVLVPTRELGVQVYQVSKQLAQYTDIQMGLAVGGLDLKAQETILRRNPDIVVATPGRLIDHLKGTPTFSLESVEVLILDEADRMLDEYFAEQMKEIIRQCSRTRQTMLFSATMTDAVEDLASVSLEKPVRIFVDSNKDVAFNLRQEFIRIRADKESDREPILANILCRTFREHCIVFVQTKKQAHRLHILLGLLGLKVGELHGNLTQPQRLEALQKFKDKAIDVLIATDVAARGLDIQGVQTVVNFTMPTTLEHYIHRVGRTARAGRVGVSVSLAGERERKIVKDIVKRAKNPVKSRLIPPDIVDKYKKKLDKLEPEIERILREEHAERLLAKAENQANRADKIMKGVVEEERPWFQSSRDRKIEKERLKEKFTQKHNKKTDKGKPKSKAKENPDDKEEKKRTKVALLQAKIAKKQHKMKKISTVREDRLGSNPKQRQQPNNKKSKLKPKKGQVFGRPQKKKQR